MSEERWPLSVFFTHIREAAQQRGLSLAEVCARVRAMGIAYAELSEEDVRGDQRKALDALEAGGLRIGCIYRWFDFAHDASTAPADAFLGLAARLGVRDVLVVPGFVTPADDVALARERMAEGVSYLCRRASAEDIRVGLEDFDGATAPYATCAEVRFFLERVPELGFTLDTGNFFFSGEDVLEALRTMGDRVGYVHLKDRRLHGEPGETPQKAADGSDMFASPVGGGVIPIREVLRGLRALGYTGKLAIEHFGAPDQLRYIEESARWLLREKALLEQA